MPRLRGSRCGWNHFHGIGQARPVHFAISVIDAFRECTSPLSHISNAQLSSPFATTTTSLVATTRIACCYLEDQVVG